MDFRTLLVILFEIIDAFEGGWPYDFRYFELALYDRWRNPLKFIYEDLYHRKTLFAYSGNIGSDNLAYKAVKSALTIEGVMKPLDDFWIDCSESEADEILAMARTNFPPFTREIEDAIAHALR